MAWSPATRRAHAGDALRRLGRDDVALADHHVVVEFRPLSRQPSARQLARGAERHHAEEIVDQRRVPAVEQVGLDAAVFGGERGQRHAVDVGGVDCQRAVRRVLKREIVRGSRAASKA